ncbi:unnamed protein product [Plutella xylostella]|uniref:(diamondback moth) hypothetical protein n=1 Tax=Plutella xylostella TaxID=51655 RepID=A0A8S4GDU5_PLUXY|nr:unnamed protein product [Plutella xylostella]
MWVDVRLDHFHASNVDTFPMADPDAGLHSISASDSRAPVPAPLGRDLVEEMWVDVRLDHFHASNVETFPMRFYYNPEFATTGDHILIYVGGEWSISPGWLRAGLMYEAAPSFLLQPEFATTGDHILIYVGGEWSISPGWMRIFLIFTFLLQPEFATTGDHILIYVGGEWSISPGWLRAGLMYEAAADAGAAMFYTEHRYYGKTRPTEARRAGQLLAVQHRLARCAQSVHVCGPEVYNALPTEIKDAPSLPAFKQYLKRWLVQHAFYTVGEFISRKT